MTSRSRSRLVLALVAVVGLTAACGGEGADDSEPSAAQGVSVERGEELFSANCAACHGQDLDGTTSGPPLVHEVYEPSHHGDDAFQRAVAEGVQAHHWDFGPMPPLPGLERSDVEDIIAYVRSEQRAADIT